MLAKAMLCKLTDAVLALVIYSQVKGNSKTMLDILETENLKQKDGLSMVWKTLMNEACTNWEQQARRRHGQSMDEWITYLKKVRLEVHDGAIGIYLPSANGS